MKSARLIGSALVCAAGVALVDANLPVAGIVLIAGGLLLFLADLWAWADSRDDRGAG